MNRRSPELADFRFSRDQLVATPSLVKSRLSLNTTMLPYVGFLDRLPSGDAGGWESPQAAERRAKRAWPVMVLGVLSIGTGIFAGIAGVMLVRSHDHAGARAALTTSGVAIGLGLALWVGGSWFTSGSVDWRTLAYMVGGPFGLLLVGFGGWIVFTALTGASLGIVGAGSIVLLVVGLVLMGLGFGVIKALKRLLVR
jgi:hypothetical protein